MSTQGNVRIVEVSPSPAKWVLAVALAIVLLIGIVFGTVLVSKSVSRHQKIADAKNEVTRSQIEANNKTKLNEIRIAQQAQLVQVAKQQAQIRYENSIGVRKAQDEIAKTLTPLYVQFEAIEAMKRNAKYGGQTIYIPAGNNGIPLVSQAPGPVTSDR